MRSYLTIILLLFMVITASGQTSIFWLEGTVHGYEYDPGRGLLKKVKPAVLEGTLENANISVWLDDELVEEVLSNEKGNYNIPLDFDKLYTIVIKKEGYNTNTLLLDTRAFPKEIKKGGYHFIGAEFVLNSYKRGKSKQLDRNFGRLYYSPGQQLFKIYRGAKKEETADAPSDLLERAVVKNNEKIKHYQPDLSPRPAKGRSSQLPFYEQQQAGSEQEGSFDRKKSKLNISPKLKLGLGIGDDISDTSILSSKEGAILKAREQLALDKLRQQTKFDSLEILKREAQIQVAEQEIKNARLLIHTQQDKLMAQRNFLILLFFMLILLVGFLLLVYYYFRNKQRNSILLEQKNKQITDSINYAQRIQQTILVSERTLKSYLPDSFVLSQPRDIVSGDFYFFHPHPKGLVVAVADCTGHGIPGAFMSLIGHRLLREIIAERGITDPAQILDQLNIEVQQALQGEKEGDILQDGMDISVCLIDPENHTITFAAAMNPAYLMNDYDLHVLQADIISIGGKLLRNERKRQFSNKAIAYTTGNMLYLFSDGFMDQFGETLDQKFNTRRFKEMLTEMQHLPAETQKEKASEYLQQWKGAVRQTDDILLMGIRLP